MEDDKYDFICDEDAVLQVETFTESKGAISELLP